MPSATVVRRRRVAVLAVAAAALILGVSVGAGHKDSPPAATQAPSQVAQQPLPAAPTASPSPEAVEKLSLKEQVGKLVVLRFNGTTAPTYVKDILDKGWAAGAILFKDNITDPDQLRQLTKQLRRGKQTPIICTDQEGGVIRNVVWAPPEQAQAGQVARRDAQLAAQALKKEGINVTLAPVADVPSVSGAAMGSRAFSREPAQAAAKTKAAVQGWIEGKVAPTAKHFPGLGGTTINTDRAPTSIPNAPTAADLQPFKAAIEARVPLIMSSHARYPRLDGQHIASQSRPILTTLLRDQLHFEGVVITDSIEAAAARATGSTEQIAVRSIAAGNDVVLTTGRGSWIRTYRALLAQARSSKAFRARVKASAARVLALQDTLS